MKTPLSYGFFMALAGVLLTMALFFVGLHDEASKIEIANIVGSVGGIAIAITFIALGAREQRSLTPADKSWGYGSAFLAAFLTGLFGVLFGIVFNYLYLFHINPGFSELIFTSEMAKLEASDAPSEAVENARPLIKTMTSAPAMVITQTIMGFLGNTVIALVVAAFFKKRPESASPAAAA